MSEAIRLDPKLVRYYSNRASAYAAKGDTEHAPADYDEMIKLNPKNAYNYRTRGLAYFYSGALPKALADINQASDLDPKEAYHAIWLDIIGQRNKVPSRLSQSVPQIDMTVWPAPVIRMFLGQLTPAAVLAAADNADAKTKSNQVCEANFYSGELALRQGAKDEAARLFKIAVSDCPKTFIEWDAAKSELKGLGVAN